MTVKWSDKYEPWAVPAKYEKIINVFATTPDNDNIGRILYKKHCNSCHGIKGLGDGKKSAKIKATMPDFSSAEFKAQTDGAMYYKTYIGRDEMPAFKNKISDKEDQWLLINYIKNM